MLSDFTPELVLRAYAGGIFPMGHDDGVIRWYSPDPRCVIDLSDFHVPKRLARTIRKNSFDLRINAAWEAVLRGCADRQSTWITDDILNVYTELHKLGFAHSVEAFKDGVLAGGLYGVSIRGAFMGESMFHTVTDASKVCLIYLVNRLRERGFVVLDCQYMTGHLRTFGAKQVPRQEYLALLAKALTRDCRFA